MRSKNLLISSLLAITLAGCSSEEHIAIVDGQEIGKQQYNSYLQLKNVPAEDKQRFDQMLDGYLERSALTKAIEKSGALPVEKVNAEVLEFKKQILISRYFEQYLRDKVTDESIRNYYANNIEKYQSQKVKVAHVLFRVNPKMDETQRKAIHTTAHEAYSKLQAGEKFDDIAKAYSEDKVSKKKGGELGWINQGAVSPEFSEKAFNLEPGKYTEPFLTSFGFHILKVIDGPKLVKKPLESVKGDIRYQLRNEAKQAEVKRLLSTIKVEKTAS